MPLTIPNTPASPTAEQSSQSMPDQRDFDAIVAAETGTGVVGGCAVTQTGGGAMSVTVAAGAIVSAGIEAAVTAGTVTITTADATNPRFDLIVASSAGALSAVAGTPAAAADATHPGPVFPAIPAGSVLIAAVYVAASAASILTADIQDKRAGAVDPLAVSHLNPLANITIPPGYEASVDATPYIIPSGILMDVQAGAAVVLDQGVADPTVAIDLPLVNPRPGTSQRVAPGRNAVVQGGPYVLDAGIVLDIQREGLFVLDERVSRDVTYEGAPGDITLPTGVYQAGTGTLKGGKINHATSINLSNTYTQDADATDISIGTAIYVGWNPTLNYAGDSLVGPVATTGLYGKRGVVQVEGFATWKFDAKTFGEVPASYSDQLVVKNNTGTTRVINPAWSHQAVRVYVADGGVVSSLSNSWAPASFNTGACAFVDNTSILTAAGGTWTMTNSNYDLLGFISAPFIQGNVTLTTRVAYDVKDITTSGVGPTFDLAYRSRLSGTIDTAAPSITNNIGVRIPRLTKGTNNYGIVCDSPFRLWDDTVTFTALPDRAFQMAGTYTLDYATATLGPILFNPTVSFKQAGSSFGSYAGPTHLATIKNDPALTGALGPATGFSEQSIVQADTNATTMSNFTAFGCNLGFNRINAGTLTVSQVTNFNAAMCAPAVGATVTTCTGYQVANPGAPVGTLTNMIGVDIQNLTRGATLNLGLRNASPTVFTPSAGQTLVAATAVLANATVVMVNCSGAVTTTAAPTIADGQDGQILTILMTAGTSWTIQDQGTLASSNVRLVGTNMVMGPRDNITLVYSATVGDWVEIARSNVT